MYSEIKQLQILQQFLLDCLTFRFVNNLKTNTYEDKKDNSF